MSNISFDIMRITSEDCDFYFTESEFEEFKKTLTEEQQESYFEEHITLDIEFSGDYAPAKVGVAYEDSYPEYDSLEICSAIDDFGDEWINDLTKEEKSDIISAIHDMIE